MSLKLAVSILRDREAAEDEVQNSYWKAWRGIRQFQRQSKFSTWISRIVINRCLMRMREDKRGTLLYLEDRTDGGEARALELPDRGGSPEEEFGKQEITGLVATEIRKLPALMRNVLLMRDVDELPMPEVAERLGVSIVAAKSRLLRARMELRNRLERQMVRAGTLRTTRIPA